MADNLKVGLEVSADTADADAKLKTTGSNVENLGASGKSAAQGLNATGASVEATGTKAEHSASLVTELRRGLVELAAASVGIEAAKELTDVADEAQNAAAKIRLVTSSDEEFAKVQQALLDLSLQTRTSYADNVTFYQRLYNATKNLTDAQGQQLYNSQDLIRVQTTLNEALQLSGATSTEATNGLIQLSQGLASGRLQGQDLRAVLDDIPGVANALADGLGVSIGKLRALATAGQLTPEEVVNALLREGEAVDSQFKTLPETVGGAITNLKTQLLSYVGQVNSSSGASQDLVSIIEALAKNIDLLGNAAEVAGVAALGKLAKETTSYISSSVAAYQATQAQRAEQLQLATAQQSAAAATLAETQALKAAALAKAQDAEAAAALAKTDEEVAAAATALGAAEAELAAAQEAAAVAQTRATAAAKDYEAVATAGSVTSKLLGGGVAGLVGNLVNLGVAFEVGYQGGQILYDKFEIVRKAGNALVEGLLLLNAELFGTGDDVKRIEQNFDSAVTSSDAFGESAKRSGSNAAAGAKQANDAVDSLLGTLAKSSEVTQTQTVTLDNLGKKLKSLSDVELADFAAKAQAGFSAATAKVKALTDAENELSGQAAVDLINANQTAFNAASTEAEKFGKVLEAVHTEDLRKLGVDADLIRTGVDKATTEAIKSIQSLGSISTTTGAEMTAAFNAALGKATTKEDALALVPVVNQVKTAGFNAAGAIKQINDRLKELPAAAAALDPVNQALKRLGVDGVAQLDLIAHTASDDFNTISASGTQSATVVAAAFAKMADAQLKAAAAAGEGQLQAAEAALKAEARTEAESSALDKVIAKYPQVSAAATQTANTQVASASAARQAYDALVASISKADSVEQLQQIRNGLTDAYTAGTAGAQDYQSAITAAYQKEDELAHEATGAASALANQITYLRNQYVDMGTTATAAFDAIVQKSVIVGESVGDFIDNFNRRLSVLDQYTQQQTSRAQQLTAALSGTAGQTQLNLILAQQAAQSFQYLDSQTLSGLNAAIAATKQNLDSLRQSADQTLSDLQDQLDQLNGNTLAIEQRQNAAKQADIEQQLQAAQQAGDRQSVSELQQSLQLLQQIGQTQQRQAQQQTTATPASTTQSMGSYDLNLTINGQQLGTVQASSQQQAEAIVKALQAAQSTSTVQ